MRIFPLITALIFCQMSFAATASWTGMHIMSGNDYWFSSSIILENGEHARIRSDMFGHSEAGEFYLKHYDFSRESMEPTYNWWVLAVYGDIVDETTFKSLTPIEDFRGNDCYTGGTLIPNPNDFYMAFKVSQVLVGSSGYEEGMSWYGWVHVSVDDSLEMTLLGADINLSGGAVTVGELIPEPSAGVLFLVGLAALGLRRRRSRGGAAVQTGDMGAIYMVRRPKAAATFDLK